MKDKKDRVVKLPDAQLKAHLKKKGPTKSITIINNGADDKFELVLIAEIPSGGSGMFLVLDDLPQLGSATIPLSQLAFQFVSFHLRWRDKNGIGRYTETSEAAPGKFYRDMTCFWAADPRDPTIEECLLYGNEIRL